MHQTVLREIGVDIEDGAAVFDASLEFFIPARR